MKCPNCDEYMEKDGSDYVCTSCNYRISGVFNWGAIMLLIIIGLVILMK